MGLFGKKEVKAKKELISQFLSLNKKENPYVFSRGKNTDIIVEWKISRADYIKFFGKEKLDKKYKAYILLDESNKVIKYFEELSTEASSLTISPRGKISFGTQKKFFTGKSTQMETKKVISFAELFRGRKPTVIDYTFSNKKVKDAIKNVAKANGWKFQSVVSKKQILK